MNNLKPVNQTYLFGLHQYLQELIELDKKKCLPNKFYSVDKKV